MRYGILSWLILCFGMLSGCASTSDTSPKLQLHGVSDADLDARFVDERRHLDGRRPKIGLAMSGGGTKSAMFSHGVLHGLQATGVLQELDAISTVSGGGYAAFWYFSHAMEAQRQRTNLAAIFEDCFPYWWLDDRAEEKLRQVFARGKDEALKRGKKVCYDTYHQIAGDPFRWESHILRWPDVFGTEITTVTGNVQKAPTAQVEALFGRAVLEMLTFWSGRESYVAIGYQEGIERAWGLNPLPRKRVPENTPESSRWEYSNSASSTTGNSIRVDPKSAQWADLRKLYSKESKLPLWIVNTNSGQKGPSPNLSHLYEITPFGFGSPNPKLPYSSGEHPEAIRSMATSTRASAAFLDPQGLGSPMLATVLNWVSAVVPAIRWGVRIDSDGTRLSDGGGVDNLGLVSLVRRGLDDIIVVDSAQDDQGQFQDLCWTQRALKLEGLTLKMDGALQNFDKVCAQHFEGKHGQKLGYNVSAWNNPVIPGVVTWNGTGRTTRIWVIKAGWNQKQIRESYNHVSCGDEADKVPCELLLFYGHNTNPGDGYMLFPQHETVSDTLNASSYQIFGYREIGKMLASKLRMDPQTHAISLVAKELKMQPLYCIRKSGRPGPGPYDSPDSEPNCPEAH